MVREYITQSPYISRFKHLLSNEIGISTKPPTSDSARFIIVWDSITSYPWQSVRERCLAQSGGTNARSQTASFCTTCPVKGTRIVLLPERTRSRSCVNV